MFNIGKPAGEEFDLMNRRGPISGSLLSSIVLSLLLALAYLLLGMFAFSMAVQNANITCQAFFPEGVSLVCVILFGPRVAPGIFLGQLVLAQYTGLPADASAVIALINALQGILGGYLFWRWRISLRLNRPRDIAMLFLLCALIVQPISATGGIAAQYFLVGLETERFVSVWLYWWAGNVLGQMLVLPLVLTWVSTPKYSLKKKEIQRALLVVGLYFIPVGVFVFGDWGENGPLYRLLTFAAFYLPLIWLAVQSRVQTVALANLLLTSPFLCLINAGPDLSIFFSNQNRHLCADIIILAGIVTSLLISALWEQLFERKQQLREASEAREKLFSVIGHDLRGPVANLKSFLDLMGSGTLGMEDFQQYQAELRKGVNHVHVTLQNLMEWGSLQTKSLQPRAESVSLRSAAHDGIELLSLVAKGKEIEIENTLPEHAHVLADANQIQSVMRNLLSNALKFTPKGGRIQLQTEKQGASWRTSVADSGIGMDEKLAARVLDPDRENVSTLGTANERGLGLGLQLCLDFIKANAGSLWVESTPGEGTVFFFVLPSATSAPGE